MCGITGILNWSGRPEEGHLHTMLAALRHRGPDGLGTFLDGPAALGHTRLSILDLQGGHQPMSNEDGSLWIVFNGEIFNYVELREGLTRKGYRFRTRSDTEVLLRLYQEEGEECVSRLNGQWAFSIWDKRTQELFLSRDRLGILPLFYVDSDQAFLWASEIKALLAHPSVSHDLDLAALDEIFTFWVTLPPRTAYREVRQLPPGCSMRVRHGGIRIHQYWTLGFAPAAGTKPTPAEEEAYADELLELLTDATRIRLRSDVPVGCYLSGGLDSSVITALARKLHSDELRSFSVTFDRGDLDESEHQLRVSKYLGTLHHSVHASDQQLAEVFPEVVRHAETPLLRTAPAPLYLLSRCVRDNCFKVALTGEGADEILGGYDIFKEAKVRRFWAEQPESHIRPLLLKRLYPYMPALQSQSDVYLRNFFRPADLMDPFDSHRPRWQLTSSIKQLLSAEVRSQLGSSAAQERMYEAVPPQFFDWDPLSRAQYLESQFLLPGYILSSQGDRMAMAHSVELRPPFLDHRIAELACRLPPIMRIRVLAEKYLLKRVARRLLPPEVARRPKQPFRSPDGESFFAAAPQEHVLEALSPDAIRHTGVFDPAKVAALVHKFRAGRASGARDNMALTGVLSTQLLVRMMSAVPALRSISPSVSLRVCSTDNKMV